MNLLVELSAGILGLQASVLGFGLVGANTVTGGLKFRVAKLKVVLASRSRATDTSRETVQNVADTVEQAGSEPVGGTRDDLLNIGVGARVLDQAVDTLEDTLRADGDVARLLQRVK